MSKSPFSSECDLPMPALYIRVCNISGESWGGEGVRPFRNTRTILEHIQGVVVVFAIIIGLHVLHVPACQSTCQRSAQPQQAASRCIEKAVSASLEIDDTTRTCRTRITEILCARFCHAHVLNFVVRFWVVFTISRYSYLKRVMLNGEGTRGRSSRAC